ncbi:MAG TPA: hypothetical protein VK669_14275 [Candidatus Limnocylindrales bacterium]|nr:hypothetical protein [Candidatus Limnocylindrales bacterium]
MIVASSSPDVAERWAEPTPFWAVSRQIAERYGTPFYLYFPEHAVRSFEALSEAAEAWGAHGVAYSLKTNRLTAILCDLERVGALVEVVSAWELRQARKAGFPADRIIFNGPLKPKHDLHSVVRDPPLTINADSSEELHVLRELAGELQTVLGVGVRVCPPHIDGVWSRFGMELDNGELDAALDLIEASPGLALRCVHIHLGTQVHETRRYREVVGMARRLWDRRAFPATVRLDIGGGFPYEHDRPFAEQSFSPRKFFGELTDAWGDRVRPALLLEPGRYVAAPAMAIVSRVLSRKPRTGEPSIIVLDSGTNHNVMAAFYDHLWSFQQTDAEGEYRFCGPLCMEDDVLSGRRYSPLPVCGDLVATLNAGAYSLALLREFIQPAPPVFAVRPGGVYERLDSVDR